MSINAASLTGNNFPEAGPKTAAGVANILGRACEPRLIDCMLHIMDTTLTTSGGLALDMPLDSLIRGIQVWALLGICVLVPERNSSCRRATLGLLWK